MDNADRISSTLVFSLSSSSTSGNKPSWGSFCSLLLSSGGRVMISEFINCRITGFSLLEMISPKVPFANNFPWSITANEHRENFSLTRFPGSIEREFPGVHCDIGGAYENGMEVVDEIETSNHKPLWFLNKRRQQLIDEHWYNEEQIEINNKFLNAISFGNVYRKITGTRFLRKEYSYIPLHFMEEHGVDLYDHQLIIKTETSYSIEHDQYLPSAKNLLHGYVFEGEDQWRFKTDEEFEKEKQERARERLLNPQPEPAPEPVPEMLDENGNKVKTTVLQGVTVTGYHPQTLLRIIRNQYLHWSANRDWMGMDPNNDYQRRIYPE